MPPRPGYPCILTMWNSIYSLSNRPSVATTRSTSRLWRCVSCPCCDVDASPSRPCPVRSSPSNGRCSSHSSQNSLSYLSFSHFLSSLKDYDTLLTVINVSDKKQVINLTDFIDHPRQLVVEIAGVDSAYEPG